MWVNWEEQLEGETHHATQGSSAGENKASESLAIKTCGGGSGRRNSQSLESGARDEQAALFPL